MHTAACTHTCTAVARVIRLMKGWWHALTDRRLENLLHLYANQKPHPLIQASEYIVLNPNTKLPINPACFRRAFSPNPPGGGRAVVPRPKSKRARATKL